MTRPQKSAMIFSVQSALDQDLIIHVNGKPSALRGHLARGDTHLECQVCAGRVIDQLSASAATAKGGRATASLPLSWTEEKEHGGGPEKPVVNLRGVWHHLTGVPDAHHRADEDTPQLRDGTRGLLLVIVDSVVGLPAGLAGSKLSVKATLTEPNGAESVVETAKQKVEKGAAQRGGARNHGEDLAARRAFLERASYVWDGLKKAGREAEFTKEKLLWLFPDLEYFLSYTVAQGSVEEFLAEVKTFAPQKAAFEESLESLWEEGLRLELKNFNCSLKVELLQHQEHHHHETKGPVCLSTFTWTSLKWVMSRIPMQDDLVGYPLEGLEEAGGEIFLQRKAFILDPR